MKAMVFAFLAMFSGQTGQNPVWTPTSVEALEGIDDDVSRNGSIVGYFDGIEIRQVKFTENGFAWHMIRYHNIFKQDGPLWLVPHDDENAAFDAMITAIKDHGGVGLAINSGPGSARMQAGSGVCGVNRGARKVCDPNRNFDANTPIFTTMILDQRAPGQPVIALHTNSPGFHGDGDGGRGLITVLDTGAFKRGELLPRADAEFAARPVESMANFDTLGLMAYLAKDEKPSASAVKCGNKIAEAGIHFWHERVEKSDGSMSNYLILNFPDIAYFNAESRAEAELAIAASRHRLMVKAFLERCTSGH